MKDGTRGQGVYDTHIEPNGILSLTYNPYIVSCQSKNTLLACLRHEACHILTIPMSNVPVPQTSPEMMEFLANQVSGYDEYLAHREFLKRWPNDQVFLTYKRGELANFSLILFMLRKRMQEGTLPNLLSPFNTLSAIFQDAVYFRIIDDGSLREWGGRQNANVILDFFEFWFSDFVRIFDMSTNRDRTIDLVQSSGALSLSVDPQEMVNNISLSFESGASSIYAKFMANRKTAQEQELITTWLDRAK